MQSNMQEWRNFYDAEVDIEAWRSSWYSLLEKSHEILAFSHSSKEIFLKAYPSMHNRVNVTPHTVEDITPIQLQKNYKKTTTTIGVLGAINYVKGAEIIKQMVQIIERDHLDIRVVIIGEITETIHSKHFHTTGRYQREVISDLIHIHQIDIFLIPSVWPETFSYTSQEIMMMELPLMVFDLGAPAERVARYDKGYIIKEISAQAVINRLKTLSL
jgi:glycosyltransferase involved in cell wall biosynthesis